MALRTKRDERGRRIPMPGTISRTIYDLWTDGKSIEAICVIVGRGRNYVAVSIWKSQNAYLANAYHVRPTRRADEARAA